MSEHRSVWLATADRPRYSPLLGDVDVDVAVVGGGIAGVTTALLVQRSGARVALIDASRLGAGTTGNTTGKVTSQHSLTYRELIQRHGEHRARLYARANQHAIATVAALADETDADCQFERAPSFVYTTDPGEREVLEAEYLAAERLGLPASLTDEVDLPFPVDLALRFDDQAHFHPVRYLTALARTIHERGGVVHEQSRAMDIDEHADHAIVHTDGGRIRAGAVVVATLLPFVDRGGFFAKARPTRAYGVAARLGSGGVQGMHITAGSPTWSTRPWRDGDRPGLIVVGQNHETGNGEATPARWGELERWARDHFDVESFEYRWSAQDYTTADEVPYIGRSPRSDHIYVATGFKKWGLTNGTAAGQILADLLAGRDNPWHEVFDATRIGSAETIAELIEDNLHVAQHFVKDRVGRLSAGSVAHLGRGEGGIVEIDGQTVGAYKDPAGQVHAVSVTCTHMGCTVQWNAAETSWDCPCHGSRFSHDGSVLDAPAVQPLERIEVELEE